MRLSAIATGEASACTRWGSGALVLPYASHPADTRWRSWRPRQSLIILRARGRAHALPSRPPGGRMAWRRRADAHVRSRGECAGGAHADHGRAKSHAGRRRLDAHAGEMDGASLSIALAWSCRFGHGCPGARANASSAALAKLNRRALDITVRAEHAAVARLWLEHRAAAFALVEEQAGICRHFEARATALRAGQRGLRLRLSQRLFSHCKHLCLVKRQRDRERYEDRADQ